MRIRGLGRLLGATRQIIADQRRSGAIRALHTVSSFVESSYNNEGADVGRNGEENVINRLSSAHFATALDIGANLGDWTLHAAATWPSCHIHSFEVAPETFKKLDERLRGAMCRPRVTLNPFGVSDRETTLEMFYYPDHPDLTCETNRHPVHTAVPFEASLHTLDEYCAAKGITSVDFLKIDVEGSEYKVLQGFSRYINSQTVHCVQFEYGAFSIDTKLLLIDYYKLLSDCYWIGKIYPTYVDFREYDWRMEDFRFCNYCCVSKKRRDLRDLLA